MRVAGCVQICLSVCSLLSSRWIDVFGKVTLNSRPLRSHLYVTQSFRHSCASPTIDYIALFRKFKYVVNDIR